MSLNNNNEKGNLCVGGSQALSAMREEIAALRTEMLSLSTQIASLRTQLTTMPSAQDTTPLPVPEEMWATLEAKGIVNEEHMPTGSRTEAAILAHVLGRHCAIEGWAPFERAWGIPRLRNHWQRALVSIKTAKLIHEYNNMLGR